MQVPAFDVAVVGSGNAALCAAIAALESGARVVALEAGDERDVGGNTRYTAGALRLAYEEADELRPLLEGCDDARLARSEFGRYPRARFLEDLGGDSSPLRQRLVVESRDAVAWLVGHGLRLEPIYARQSFEVGGRHRFWGGLVLAVRGEGEGMVRAERRIAVELGLELRLGSRATSLLLRDGRVRGLLLEDGTQLDAKAVVLACGGFEADPDLRARYLGPEWRAASVRGTPWNRGDGLRMAVAAGADTAGDFSACHAVCMDAATPSFADSPLSHAARRDFRKLSYAFGVMLNARGERFVDEGADFRNYTYARYGGEVLRQPGGFAWQIFDAQVAHLLYAEYGVPDATRVESDSLEDLAKRLEGVDAARALDTLQRFNAAVDAGEAFDPSQLDGRATHGLDPPKSNWALALERPPFRAYRVGCGVTFTYGGIRIRPHDAAVLRPDGSPLAGLHAAGEVVGDVFGGAYPGGSGLTAGVVFGRAAGRAAAECAKGG